MKTKWMATLAAVLSAGWLSTDRSVADTPSPGLVSPTPSASVPANPDLSSPSALDAHASHHGPEGGWDIRVDGLYFHRDVPRKALFEDLGPTTATTDNIVYTTRNVQFDFVPGIRVTGSAPVAEGVSIEASYFGLEQSHGSAVITAESTRARAGLVVGSLFSGFGSFDSGFFVVTPFDGAFVDQLDYTSRLHNGEVNARWRMVGNDASLSFLAGIRYVKLDEQFGLTSTGLNLAGAPLTGVYNIATHNDAVGFQIGSDCEAAIGSGLSLQFLCKGGVLANFAKQQTNISNAILTATGAPFTVSQGADNNVAACIAEFGATINWWPTENIGVHVGYQGLFITNIADAPHQFSFTTALGGQSLISTSGSVFYHGPTAGVELRW